MNLAVFLDGTWNDRTDLTNVVQLRDRVLEAHEDGTAQAAYYDEGVGTGPFQRLRGGILGKGLNRNIREAYAWIAERYQHGRDRIFLFGYSRGAFTARSLGGMIAKCGIVRSAHMPEDAVFARYRRGPDAPGLREMQIHPALARTDEDRLVLARSTLVRIRFVGVFDTVGSLGIPGGLGKLFARRKYAFHDTNLSGLVDVARHAVAVDEHRRSFVPTLWTDVPIPIEGHPTSVEQRWFCGAHSNVGGGGTSVPSSENPLATIAHEWLAGEAAAAGLALGPPRWPMPEDAWRGGIRDSYARFLLGTYRLVVPRRFRPVRTALGETLSPTVGLRWHGEPGYAPRRNSGLAEWVAETPPA